MQSQTDPTAHFLHSPSHAYTHLSGKASRQRADPNRQTLNPPPSEKIYIHRSRAYASNGPIDSQSQQLTTSVHVFQLRDKQPHTLRLPKIQTGSTNPEEEVGLTHAVIKIKPTKKCVSSNPLTHAMNIPNYFEPTVTYIF